MPEARTKLRFDEKVQSIDGEMCTSQFSLLLLFPEVVDIRTCSVINNYLSSKAVRGETYSEKTA